MKIRSELHKELVGHVNGMPFRVFFDAQHEAVVDEAVGAHLLRLSAAVEVRERTEIADGYSAMTNAELKAIISNKGLKVPRNAAKEQLIAVIEGGGEDDGE